uniref:Uncharacterized protein n=1 Tax=Brassica campestris TaxID=3711 RepID=A0A3P6CT94_BRACM|nr:unnamed protein product [Brassica rapa]
MMKFMIQELITWSRPSGVTINSIIRVSAVGLERLMLFICEKRSNHLQSVRDQRRVLLLRRKLRTVSSLTLCLTKSNLRLMYWNPTLR